jgi:hypothetical protein
MNEPTDIIILEELAVGVVRFPEVGLLGRSAVAFGEAVHVAALVQGVEGPGPLCLSITWLVMGTAQ